MKKTEPSKWQAKQNTPFDKWGMNDQSETYSLTRRISEPRLLSLCHIGDVSKMMNRNRAATPRINDECLPLHNVLWENTGCLHIYICIKTSGESAVMTVLRPSHTNMCVKVLYYAYVWMMRGVLYMWVYIWMFVTVKERARVCVCVCMAVHSNSIIIIVFCQGGSPHTHS